MTPSDPVKDAEWVLGFLVAIESTGQHAPTETMRRVIQALDYAIYTLKRIRDENYCGDMEDLADIRWEIAHDFLEKLKC